MPTADQRVVTYNVPWSHFEAQLALRGDKSAPRMAFLDGALELMSPSKDHERAKSYIGRLVDAYALERGIELTPYGGWTLKNAPREAGLEPDECYLVGPNQERERPDLAIEVIWTSGGLNKLEIYRRLGIGEVWIWKEGRITVHVLGARGYEEVEKSHIFPDLDLAFVCSLMAQPTATQAVRALQQHLRQPGQR